MVFRCLFNFFAITIEKYHIFHNKNMLFGSLCFLDNNVLQGMTPKSIIINGFQRSLIVNFEVEQSFYHSEKNVKEISYIFPNDFKICIYDTTFIVGDEIIKPKIKSQEEAKATYKEAVDSGHTAIYGTNIGDGMTRVKIGNVPPDVECKVILKIAFTGNMINEKTFYIKFPIEVYSSYGPCGCLKVDKSEFSFQLQSNPEEVEKITSNIKNSNFDEKTKMFSIKDSLINEENEKSIIITFETNNKIESSCLLSQTSSSIFDSCAILVSPNYKPLKWSSKEFIFLIDCSGSMRGRSIRKASECLKFFIKSLPADCYFNVIKFGSMHFKLFNKSVLYNDETSNKAINWPLDSTLGGTDIYSPLNDIISDETLYGQRQIFLITDGEAFDAERIFNLVSSNSNDNRCFTIGIGRGCDAGLVEGIARLSGGLSGFVQKGDSISNVVINQLHASFYGPITSLEIHIEGESNDSFEVSPFPLPQINSNGSSVIYVRQRKKSGTSSFMNGMLITGKCDDESIEIPVFDVQNLTDVDEDRCGRSFGENIGKAILPLFAFASIQKIERKNDISEEDKARLIELSIDSGVLCKYTGFVGLVEKCERKIDDSRGEEIVESETGRKHRRKKMSSIQNEETRIRRRHRRMQEGSEKEESQKLEADEGIEMNRKSRHKHRQHDEEESQKLEADEGMKRRRHRRSMQKEGEEEIKRRRKSHNESEKEDNYDLISLICCQKSEGYWDDLDEVKRITGIKIDKIEEINLSDKSNENKCIATILAITAMRVKFPNEKTSWNMIEQKSLSWLKKMLPDIDMYQIISKIESSI